MAKDNPSDNLGVTLAGSVYPTVYQATGTRGIIKYKKIIHQIL